MLIPTIGRAALLRNCLLSILACDPLPDEVVVVDQSSTTEVADLIVDLDEKIVRRLPCDATGIAHAMNDGLAAVRHDAVLVTHDDCTVPADWVQTAARLARAFPEGIITGRILPPDGSLYVPSTKTDPVPRDYTGTLTSGVLNPASMIANRLGIQAIGGFDERGSLLVAAEDNDLCYRWLADGRTFRYEPDLVVWHHDWRTPEQLVKTHIAYARAQGGFYAKHLYARDWRVLVMLRWDLQEGCRAIARGVVRHVPRWQNPYREMVGSLLVGLFSGWRENRSLDRRGAGHRQDRRRRWTRRAHG